MRIRLVWPIEPLPGTGTNWPELRTGDVSRILPDAMLERADLTARCLGETRLVDGAASW